MIITPLTLAPHSHPHLPPHAFFACGGAGFIDKALLQPALDAIVTGLEGLMRWANENVITPASDAVTAWVTPALTSIASHSQALLDALDTGLRGQVWRMVEFAAVDVEPFLGGVVSDAMATVSAATKFLVCAGPPKCRRAIPSGTNGGNRWICAPHAAVEEHMTVLLCNIPGPENS